MSELWKTLEIFVKRTHNYNLEETENEKRRYTQLTNIVVLGPFLSLIERKLF